MKKVLFVALATGFIALSVTSCKKNYTCTCTIKLNDTTIGTSTFTFKDTKSKAKTACNDEAATVSSGGSNETVTCSIN
jgi:hypothetical protein